MRVPRNPASGWVRALFGGHFHFSLQEETGSYSPCGSLLCVNKYWEKVWGRALPALAPGPAAATRRPAGQSAPKPRGGSSNEAPRNSMTSSGSSLIGCRRRAGPAPSIRAPGFCAGPAPGLKAAWVPNCRFCRLLFRFLRGNFCFLRKTEVFFSTCQSTGFLR